MNDDSPVPRRSAAPAPRTRTESHRVRVQRTGESNVQVRAQVSYFKGPLPPPRLLVEYDEAVPDLGQQIADMARSEAEYRHAMDRSKAKLRVARPSVRLRAPTDFARWRSRPDQPRQAFVRSGGCHRGRGRAFGFVGLVEGPTIEPAAAAPPDCAGPHGPARHLVLRGPAATPDAGGSDRTSVKSTRELNSRGRLPGQSDAADRMRVQNTR